MLSSVKLNYQVLLLQTRTHYLLHYGRQANTSATNFYRVRLFGLKPTFLKPRKTNLIV